jgi:hypothetical protein
MGRKRQTHPKPPYYSPNPFLYRTLPHVQLVGDLDPFSLTATRKSRLQVTKCPRSRPKRLSATVRIPMFGITYVSRRQTTCQCNEVCCFASGAGKREPSSARGVPIHRKICQVITIPKPCLTCARNATANKWRAPTIIHIRPTGGKNAQSSSISL